MDNHSAHHTDSVTGYLARKKVTILFMPPYSSALNPIERTWNTFKHIWSKYMSKLKVEAPINNLDRDIGFAMREVKKNTSMRILSAANKEYNLSLANNLVWANLKFAHDIYKTSTRHLQAILYIYKVSKLIHRNSLDLTITYCIHKGLVVEPSDIRTK